MLYISFAFLSLVLILLQLGRVYKKIPQPQDYSLDKSLEILLTSFDDHTQLMLRTKTGELFQFIKVYDNTIRNDMLVFSCFQGGGDGEVYKRLKKF